MRKYTEETKGIFALIDSQPRHNRRTYRYIGEKVNKASTDYLERLRQEIYDGKPQWEKDLLQSQLEEEELALNNKEGNKSITPSYKPKLTTAYLISIGRPDLVDF